MIDEEDRAEIGRTLLAFAGIGIAAVSVVAGIVCALAPPEVEIGPYQPKPVEVTRKPPPPAPKIEEPPPPPPPEPVARVHHSGAHHSTKKTHHSDAAPGTAEAVGDIDLKDFAKPGAIKPPPPPGSYYGGKHCTVGKPCGNTCIPASHRCTK